MAVNISHMSDIRWPSSQARTNAGGRRSPARASRDARRASVLVKQAATLKKSLTMGCGASAPETIGGSPHSAPETSRREGTAAGNAAPAARRESAAVSGKAADAKLEAPPGASRLTTGVTISFLRDLPGLVAKLGGEGFPEVRTNSNTSSEPVLLRSYRPCTRVVA